MKRNEARAQSARGSWWQSPFLWALSGGILLWAAFPPLGWSWLAWLVPIPWLWLIQFGSAVQPQARRPEVPADGNLSDKRSVPHRPIMPLPHRSYLKIWLGAAIPWLLLLEGIRRAHPANNAGLVALGLYVAAYVPVFVAVTRVAVHRAGAPLLLAAPVVWTALELVRGHMLTGFSMALLGHTLAEWTWLIQIADLAGAYAVSFVIVFVAAALVTGCPLLRAAGGTGWQLRPLVVAAALLTATGVYGGLRRQNSPPVDATPQLSVALLQGTRDKIFEFNRELDEQTEQQYWALMRRAVEQHPDVDLIIWPESTLTSGPSIAEVLVDETALPPPDFQLPPSEFREMLARQNRAFADYVSRAAVTANRVWRDGQFEQGSVWQLAGAETVQFRGESMDLYNSALLIDPEGNIVNRYYKMHRVMFGEYIPFGETFPWLYSWTPMPRGLTVGTGPVAFEVKGFQLAPNICFEVTVPHLIRRHVKRLERETGRVPDVLVNVTDDGWFWGSTILDLQLACAVFRAVEMRRPMLVAANTGISAWIDGNGELLRRGPKRQEDLLLAQVVRDTRSSVYRSWGDVPALSCLALSAVWLISARFRKKLGPAYGRANRR